LPKLVGPEQTGAGDVQSPNRVFTFFGPNRVLSELILSLNTK
jgi:hypothetical protein